MTPHPLDPIIEALEAALLDHPYCLDVPCAACAKREEALALARRWKEEGTPTEAASRAALRTVINLVEMGLAWEAAWVGRAFLDPEARLADLWGAAPGITGGKSTQEYLDAIRGIDPEAPHE